MIGPLKRLLKRLSGLVLLASAVIVMPISVVACDLNWSEPKSHFEGVSFQGYVFLVETLGEVNVDSGLTLPLRAVFRSESNSTSPYAGRGWDIPLLESNIVQIDERTFRMVEPTGWYRLFWRDEKLPNILHGQNGWKGKIQGNQITAWADCGSKLAFRDGRISFMQLGNHKFDYDYENGRIETVKENGSVLIKIDKDSISGDVKGFRLRNGHWIGVESGQRPIIQAVNNQSLVSGVAKSLTKIRRQRAIESTFEYGFDRKFNPTIRIGERLIAWDPVSRRIIKDRDWLYDIKPDLEKFKNAAIKRKNVLNQIEFWYSDDSTGKEMIYQLDGTQRITTFRGGPAIGASD